MSVLSPAANVNRVCVLLAAAGLYVAGALTAAHYLQADLPCGASSGCEIVSHDPSAYFLGIPVSIFGVLGYVLLATIAVVRLSGLLPRVLVWAGFLVSAIGTLISLNLTAHSINDLHVTCLWCITSACIMALLLVTHFVLLCLKPVGLRWSRIDLGVLVIAAAAVAGGLTYTGLRLAQPAAVKIDFREVEATPFSEFVPADAPVRGRTDARVTIVEFADLSCPACRAYHKVLSNLVAKNPHVRIVFRHLPLTFLHGHESSFLAASISEEAAIRGKFWDFVDHVYGEIEHPDPASLVRIATSLGIPSRPTPADDARVNKDVLLAKKLGIRQTPTYILLLPDGKRLVASSNDILTVIFEPQVLQWIATPSR